jgi:ribosomal protein S18 acetylase RimI-like enzyme
MTTNAPPFNLPIPNFRFRTFRGEADYPIILSLIDSCRKIDSLQWAPTLEEITNNYTHLHHCNPYQDMLFAEVNGDPVGYARCYWETEGIDEASHNWLGVHLGYVIPAWRGKGIGHNLLDFVENRLNEISTELVKTGQISATMPRFFSTEGADTETAKEHLLVHAGYKAIRYAFNMVRPDLENIPDLPLPPGLEVRPVLPEHYRQIWDASNEAFRDHWGYIPEPEEEFQKMLVSSTFDPSLWRVAWEGDQIAGMVLSFINKAENEEYNRKRGYTENICVRRPWRKRGLAKTLIARGLQALKEHGMDHAALGVDAENTSGALRLYEKMGFQVIKRFAIYRKPM